MTKEHKCEAVLKKVLELCNKGQRVSFESDWGGNTLTVFLDDSHTHVGVPDGTFQQLLESLSSTLHGGPGLSWHEDTE